MQHLFVPFKIAKKLKDLGFNEPCLGGFYDYAGSQSEQLITDDHEQHEQFHQQICLAPLYQQVQDWFLKKGIYVDTSFYPVYNGKYGYRYGRGNPVSGYTPHFEGENRYDALNKAIEEALNLIK